jgi:hypothetical protein
MVMKVGREGRSTVKQQQGRSAVHLHRALPVTDSSAPHHGNVGTALPWELMLVKLEPLFLSFALVLSRTAKE